MFESVNEIVKKRDDSFVREILVLNLAGKPEKSVEYLTNSNFHFREGSSRVRDITVDAHLLLGKKYFAEKKYDQALEQFLLTIESPDKTGIGRRSGDSRSAQIYYFVGQAYEMLGNKAKAKMYYMFSIEPSIIESDYVTYYQGLSYLKLGNKIKASESFNKLVEEGNKRLEKGSETDFFAKFGEKEAANVQLSNAYLLIGLGEKGLGNANPSTEKLKKAVELSASNLWATIELQNKF